MSSSAEYQRQQSLRERGLVEWHKENCRTCGATCYEGTEDRLHCYECLCRRQKKFGKLVAELSGASV